MTDLITQTENHPINCPCSSDNLYSECCLPRHNGSSPADTAEQLMRSRYSAYVLQVWQYLFETGPQTSNLQQEQAEMSAWCADKQWLGLKVVSHHKGGKQDATGTVEFVAFYRDATAALHQHHEHSTFERINGHWRFTQGVGLGPIDIGRNEPCPCGSGKKFKRCCCA